MISADKKAILEALIANGTITDEVVDGFALQALKALNNQAPQPQIATIAVKDETKPKRSQRKAGEMLKQLGLEPVAKLDKEACQARVARLKFGIEKGEYSDELKKQAEVWLKRYTYKLSKMQ